LGQSSLLITTPGESRDTEHYMKPLDLKKISEEISKDIDEHCKDHYAESHRKHLGASIIGHDCSRYIWYVFRWHLKESFSGRMQRLFNRGHLEEQRFIDWLKGIGAKVKSADENGKQIRVSDVYGHFGGSIDGEAELPIKYGIKDKVLLEFKTSKAGSDFTRLAKEGMEVVKPQHYEQFNVYGYKLGYDYVLYIVINKNDDSLYVQVVKINKTSAINSIAKAEKIIFSRTPPPRLSENSTYYKCKFCSMKDICHDNKEPEKNCRSCDYASPIKDGQWMCEKFDKVIPEDFIPKGCKQWTRILDL